MHLESGAGDVSSDGESWISSDAECSDAEDFEGVPVFAMVVNIAKSLVGVGILSLPAGIAAGTGVIPALLIMTAFYLVMMYSFWSIGRCCEATGAKTHGEVGLAVRGDKTFGLLMEVSNLMKTTTSCTAYALVIGHSSANVWTAFGVKGSWFVTPGGSFLMILVFILLPLCLMRDLSKLAFSSLLGLVCEAGVVVFMVVRLFTGEYLEGGEFYGTQEPGTEFTWGDAEGPDIFEVNLSVFVLIGSMSTAFFAHYNAPTFYHQLRCRSSKRFLKATVGGYTIALALCVTCMVVGYLTFGKNCKGNILHNYSPRDTWATISRAAMLLATVCGFPIVFTGLRTATLGLCRCGSTRRRIWVPVTVALLCVIGVLGDTLTNLGVVNSLSGAFLGSLMELIFPGLMIMRTYIASQQKGSNIIELFSAFEGTTVSRAVTGLGIVLLVFGTCTVLFTQVFDMELF